MEETAKPLLAESRRMSMRRKEALMGYLFIAPALAGLTLFYVLPTLRAVQISLTDWNLLRAPRFVALSNYEKLWVDETFWKACGLRCFTSRTTFQCKPRWHCSSRCWRIGWRGKSGCGR